MSSTGIREVTLRPQARPQVATLGWALRRAALGLLMLLVMVTLGAWLLYASIEPDDAAGRAPAQNEAASPQR